MDDKFELSKRYFKVHDDLRILKKKYLHLKHLCEELINENKYYLNENDRLHKIIDICYNESREEQD